MAAAQAHEVEVDSDDQLVDALRAGDQHAFDLLYERYFKRIYHFVDKRLNNRADAEETTQEVFINVLSAIDSFRGDGPFGAWVFGITRRTIAGRFKRKRHATVPLVDQEPDPSQVGGPTTQPSPLEVYEYQERLDHLNHTLEHRLSKDQRHLFELHHMHDEPISVIAARLNRSEDSVKSHLYRARRLLLQR